MNKQAVVSNILPRQTPGRITRIKGRGSARLICIADLGIRRNRHRRAGDLPIWSRPTPICRPREGQPAGTQSTECEFRS